MASFIFTVEVETNRVEGKFATREEQEEQIMEALDGANPGSIEGVGADGDSSYEIADWTVTVQPAPVKRKRRGKAA